MPHFLTAHRRHGLALLFLTSAICSPAQALDDFYFSGLRSNLWSDEHNWGNSPGIPDSARAAAIFDAASGGLIDLDGGHYALNTLRVLSGNLRLGNGTLTFKGANAGIEVDADVVMAGTIRSEAGLTLLGSGSLAVERLEGDLTLGNVTLKLGASGARSDITGLLDLGSGDLVVLAGGGAIGALTGSGRINFTNTADLVIGAGNADSDFEGAAYAVNGHRGTLRKVGTGNLRLDEFAFLTDTDIALQGGTLTVEGQSYGTVSVGAQTRLQGGGYVRQVQVAAGGVFAPGSPEHQDNPVAADIEIMGDSDPATADLVLADGAIYEVRATAVPSRANVIGSASVGAARVRLASGESGQLVPGIYEILTTSEGVSVSQGGFVTPSIFMDVSFDYSDPNRVMMSLGTDRLAFASAAVNGRQQVLANAIQSLDTSSTIYQAILYSSSIEDARFAFDNLSGESHAAAQTAFADAVGVTRNVALQRLGDLPAGDVRSFLDTGSAVGEVTAPRQALWASAYGQSFDLHRTFATSGGSAGLALGMDGMLGDWRLGAMLNAGRTTAATSGTASSVQSADYGLGLYAGTHFGATHLKLGASQTYHDVSSTRTISVPGLQSRLTADYGALTTQAFAELSHALDVGPVTVEPFLGAGIQRQLRDGFVEQGGVAALSVLESTSWSGFGTVGLRGSAKFAVSQDASVTLDGAIAYQRSVSDAPMLRASFAGNGAFALQGAASTSHGLVFDAGLGLEIGDGLAASLRYEGARSTDGTSHGVEGRLAVRF